MTGMVLNKVLLQSVFAQQSCTDVSSNLECVLSLFDRFKSFSTFRTRYSLKSI